MHTEIQVCAISILLAIHLTLAVTVNVSAAKLQQVLKANDYGRDQEWEAKLLELFPPERQEFIDSPAMIMDNDSIVLLWYLPTALSIERQVRRQQSV